MRAPPEVVQADQRRAVLHGHIHDLADLRGMHLAQRSAKDREVLREHVDQAAFNRAPARHDRVAQELLLVQVEVMRAVFDECIHLAKGALVQQQVDAFARGQATLLVLGLDACLAAAQPGGGAHFMQLFGLALPVHGPLFQDSIDFGDQVLPPL